MDFTIVENKGPKIANPLRSREQIDAIGQLHDIDKQLPFLGPTLRSLSQETKGKTSLIGFIGAPWTLAAYSVEGGHSKLCAKMKTLCLEEPALAHKLLSKYTEALCLYASHQISCGVQVFQVFESWAHHMGEELFAAFAKPYADQIARYLKVRHPDVPLVYFANGGSGYLHAQLDMAYDALSIDWQISMATARRVAGPGKVLAGNVDPMVLYGSRPTIEAAVATCLEQARGKHVLNLGHGVEKDTTEEAVEILVNAVKSHRVLLV